MKSRKATATELPSAQHYQAANGTLNQVFTVCSRFYEFLIEDGFAQTNPFRLLKKGNRFSTQELEVASSRALTPLQWDFVLDTVEEMANTEPERHERTRQLVVLRGG